MSKELLQQALDALNFHAYQTRLPNSTTAAIAALREAIAQPVQPATKDIDRQQCLLDALDGTWFAADMPFRERATIEIRRWYPEPVAQADPLIPDGWRLVPIEPTRDMLDDAGLIDGQPDKMTMAIWRAMIAAAPDSIAQAELLSDEQIEAAASALVDSCISKGHWAHATEESKVVYRKYVRAVIEAIKPTIGAQE